MCGFTSHTLLNHNVGISKVVGLGNRCNLDFDEVLTYLAQDEPAQAEKELKIARDLGIDKALIVLPLGHSYQNQKKYSELLDEIYPGNFTNILNQQILVLRGNTYLEIDNLEEASYSFNKAAEFSPDKTAPLVGQATVALRQGDFIDAATRSHIAYELNPEDPEVWLLKGSIFHAQGQFAEAIKHYTRALEFAQKDYKVLISRAGAYIDINENQLAADDLETLYDNTLFDPQIPYLLGVVHAKLGNEQLSKQYMQEASGIIQSIKPEKIQEHRETLILSSLIHYSLKEWEKALADLDIYVRRFPTEPSGRKLLGTIHFNNNDFDKAITAWNQH